MVYYDRLLTLEKHVRNTPRKNFNFEWYVRESTVDEEHPCGTEACAMGSCPVVFPKSLSYSKGYLSQFVVLDGNRLSWEDAGEKFFNLTWEKFKTLFTAQSKEIGGLGFNDLRWGASNVEVADNMRNFIEKWCVTEFQDSCYKMSMDELSEWHQVLKKTKQCRESFGFTSNGATRRDIVGAYASAHRKFREWIQHDGSNISAQEHMPAFRWYEVYDPDATEPWYECAAVVLNDDFGYTFSQFRKLIREVHTTRVLAGESAPPLAP